MKTILRLTAITLPVILTVGCATSRRQTTHRYPSSREPDVVVGRSPDSSGTRDREVVVVRSPDTRSPRPTSTTHPSGTTRRSPSRQQGARHPAEEPWVAVTISAHERQVIRDYALNHPLPGKHYKKKSKHRSLPPGLAKKVARGKGLPPGWHTKLVRGEVMPRSVYRQCQPLPEEVVVQLPPPPPGTILITIEGKVARLARATLEILDVFEVL